MSTLRAATASETEKKYENRMPDDTKSVAMRGLVAPPRPCVPQISTNFLDIALSDLHILREDSQALALSLA